MKRLKLKKETIRVLSNEMLRAAAGGNAQPIPQGFIMKDTIIIRTSGLQSASSTC